MKKDKAMLRSNSNITNIRKVSSHQPSCHHPLLLPISIRAESLNNTNPLSNSTKSLILNKPQSYPKTLSTTAFLTNGNKKKRKTKNLLKKQKI